MDNNGYVNGDGDNPGRRPNDITTDIDAAVTEDIEMTINVGADDERHEVYGRSNGVILNVTDLVHRKPQADEEIDNEALLQVEDPKLIVDRQLFSQKEFNERYRSARRPSQSPKVVLKKKVTRCTFSLGCVKDFLLGMFPFIAIMKSYSIRNDLMGDVVSGLTVGIMHIPQGMAYGMLTTLPPVYGLYMSFFPVLVYFFFGSSKHISIGTFAVACLMIGSSVNKGYDGPHYMPYANSFDPDKTPSTFAVACLMIGSSVNKGYEKMAPNINVSPGAAVVVDENATDSNSSGTVLPSSEEDGMSAEELQIRLEYAMSVTFLVGVVQLLMGIFRLGFITVYLSDPLISGFTTGAACHVFTSQIKHVFGISTERYSGAFKLIYTYRDFFSRIPTTNSITLITSILCMVLLYSVSRFINQNPKLKPKMFMPVPIELIVVVLGTLISYLVKLNKHYDVKIVNDIPTGLPMPNGYAFTHIGEVFSDAIALSIVIFAISISMGKLLAKKHEYEVDANQELIAFGISTIFSSFFSSAAPSASLSRSLVQERVGGKTQVAGVVSCCLLLVVLLAIGPYFRTLPNAVLASIIIVALRGMFLQVLDLKRLWSVSIIDFLVWIISFLATVLLDVDLGLGVAVIFAILTVVCRSQRPYSCLLGQMPGTDIYRDINVYPEAKEIPGLKIFRFDQSLFFVNTEHFRTFLYKRTVNPRDLKLIQKKRQEKLDKANKPLNKKDKKLAKKPKEESPKRVQFAIAEPETVEHTSNVSQTNGDAVTVIDEENGNTSTSPNEQTGANGESPKRVQFAIAEPETVEHTSNVSQTNGDAVTVIDEESGNTSTSPNEQTGANGIEIATGLSTPSIRVRHDVLELEVTVGPDSVVDIFSQKPECPPDVDFHTIILDCSSWSFVDSMAVKVLTAVIGEYKTIGVKICLCNCKGGVREMFAKTKFYETVDHSKIYVSIHDAVVSSLHLESPSRTPRPSTVQTLPRVTFVNDEPDTVDMANNKDDSSLISADASDE